jgi:hypothetical protein
MTTHLLHLDHKKKHSATPFSQILRINIANSHTTVGSWPEEIHILMSHVLYVSPWKCPLTNIFQSTF